MAVTRREQPSSSHESKKTPGSSLRPELWHLVTHVFEVEPRHVIEQNLALEADLLHVVAHLELCAQVGLEAHLARPRLRVDGERVREARLDGSQRELKRLLVRDAFGQWDVESPLQRARLLERGLLHGRLLLGLALLLLGEPALLALVLALLLALERARLALGALLLVLRARGAAARRAAAARHINCGCETY